MLDILAITGPIYLCIALGWLATRAGLFARADMRVLGQFVLYIALPALLFDAVGKRPIGDILDWRYLGIYALGGLATIALGLAWTRRVARQAPLAGAIHLPQDEVGNCRQFAVILRDAAERLGAQFVFNSAVVGVDKAQAATIYVATEAAPRRFDALVLCAGVQSAGLLQPLGIDLPLRPVYGYSISAHIPEPLNAPRSGVMDERYKVAITRMGQRVRVAGSAEIGGRPEAVNQAALRTLYKVLQDWFPAAGRLSSGVQVWKGARPMLPDGPPVIGPSGIPGLWLNLGHGSTGWALSCGSARVLADQIAGRRPEIDTEGLGMARYLVI